MSVLYGSLRHRLCHPCGEAFLGSCVLADRYDQKPEADSISNRRRVEWIRDIEAGDEIDIVLQPRGSHACDGMSVIDIIIWPAAAFAA